MDMHLQIASWRRHAPDWVAAAVSGFAAGALLMVLELGWVAMFGAEGPWRSSHLVAAIALGPQTAFTSEFNLTVVLVALLTHYALGIGSGFALAAIVAVLHREDSVFSIELIGMAFGALVYFVNFHGMTIVMPWFIEMRGWATLMAHLAFGFVAAVLYWKLRRAGPTE
jgi:enoyl-CoA hydratase/carnithine racemase